MKNCYDLSSLDWSVEGCTPYIWLFERLYGGMGDGSRSIDVPRLPAQVPGSVQGALRRAGILPDWAVGSNYRLCEWIENRHWIYRTALPDAWLAGDPRDETRYRLVCLGLDYCGWVYVNQRLAGTFQGTHRPHSFDLTPFLQAEGNVLEIVFDLPPRWLGQFGYSSQMKEWKPRYNYTWDWSPRLVQVGIWDAITLEAVRGSELGTWYAYADYDLAHGTGVLDVSGEVAGAGAGHVEITLEGEQGSIRRAVLSVEDFCRGLHWEGLPVQAWWPNLEGPQPLYTLTCRLLDGLGAEQEHSVRRVGFKHVAWLPCPGAPPQADPWLCQVNGRPVFLQGVNFAPLRANFADVQREDYEQKLKIYRQLGANLLRINACQFLERQEFYDLCDELGLMVWQEFPLTSSGLENWPPEDEASIAGMAEIATSFIQRRHHHACLLLWSGGNELQGDLEGRKSGIGLPCTLEHPMLHRLQQVAQALDPIHRFIPTSPSGPRGGATEAEFGQGLHWDVHGGAAMMNDLEAAQRYWTNDDALFRSEIYCPGASPAALIAKYSGDFPIFPASTQNPYWTRLTTWWNDWQKLTALHEREPVDLEEYVAWSQQHQAQMLSLEMRACKERFPHCGGVLLWSGHDTFPLAINSSLIDYEDHLKPAALAVAQVWQRRQALPRPESNQKEGLA